MSLSMLHCEGKKIINAEGKQVFLRGTADWEYILMLFNDCSYNWQTWTYKGHCAKGETSQWFMVGSDDPGNVVDINNDSAEDIERKWSSVRTEICCKPMNDHALLSEYAKA